MSTHKNPSTFLDRDNWMRDLNASGEPFAARCLGIAIALHLSVKNGRCDPSHLCLKKDTGMPLRSIGRWLARLVRDGWLGIKRGGRSNNNNYLLMIGQHVADQESDRSATAMADQESFPDFDRPLSADDRPLSDDMIGHFASDDRPIGGQQKERTTKREKKGKRRKTLARCARDTHPAPDFDPPGTEEPAARAKTSANSAPSAKHPNKNKGDGAGATAAEMDAAFARFMSVYPKRVGIDGARKAWARVIKNAADAERAIEAAKRYAVERRGEPARYTFKPENWIKAGHWKDPPPDGLVIDGETGEPVAVEQPQPQHRQYRDPSAERWALAAQLKRELCGPQETEVDNDYLQ